MCQSFNFVIKRRREEQSLSHLIHTRKNAFDIRHETHV
ncbi:hypothetical protein MED222_06255 [Vibrio sp. MED222]|nr:hypothetical protein MED222_06255 [Vibrio sp. MED222]